MIMNGSNCNECLCIMLNSSIYPLNCFTNNSLDVTCQLFPDGMYADLNSSQIKINLDSTFYFQRNNQSQITTTSQSMLTFARVVLISRTRYKTNLILYCLISRR